MNNLDENEIKRAVATFKAPGQLFEVRIIDVRKRIYSGYFRDADKLIEQLELQDRNGRLDHSNVFYTLNWIKDECEGRQQFNQFLIIDPTTSDADIFAYTWLLIDMDPVRPSGTSSTDEQLELAHQKARSVYSYLLNRGFPRPIVGVSGNGYHLQYRLALDNTKENIDLMKKVLEALGLLFDDDSVKIDRSVFNPARVCKLYGTKAHKGSDTPKQPHRMSGLVTVPKTIETVPRAYLEKLVEGTLPKPQPRMQYNNYSPKTFDIEEWMDKHGIRYKKASAGDYDKYVLEQCPFDSSHKAPDSMITRGRSGELGFKCLHNSCAGYHWRDVRLMFEPDAYDGDGYQEDDGHIEAGYAQHKQNREIETPADKIELTDAGQDTSRLNEPAYYTAADILAMPAETHDFIHTGIHMIDGKMGGLERGAVSVVSGLRGGSKSTWLTQIGLNAVNENARVLFHSFEMKTQTVFNWFAQMAAGPTRTQKSHYSEYSYYVPDPVKAQIANWMGDRLWIYNNNYGNNYEKLYRQLWEEVKSKKPDLIILDNLMALDISMLDSKGDMYLEQTAFVNSLVTLAKQSNTHIIFVAHPRKANGFLRLNDISGSGNIANAVSNAFIVHRNNEDFRNLTQQMFRWKPDNPIYTGTNVIEIAKDRNTGIQDLFIPLWYEVQTKRLKNSQTEEFHYGWEADPSNPAAWVHTDKTFEELAGGT